MDRATPPSAASREVEAQKFTVNVEVAVEIEINDPDVIERITGPGGDEWRAHVYRGIRTEEDVLNHLAYNCVANGVENAALLDGWADLPRDAVQMHVKDFWENYIEAESDDA